MSTRCVACRKPIERGQLFCPDCLEKRAPASARKRERRRFGQLLELILSLPFLAATEQRRARVISEDTMWGNMLQEIQSDPKIAALFIEAAASRGIELPIEVAVPLDVEPSVELDALLENIIDPSTAMLILDDMATIIAQRSSRYKTDVFDVQRRLLALSSSLLGALVVALTLLSLVLFIID